MKKLLLSMFCAIGLLTANAETVTQNFKTGLGFPEGAQAAVPKEETTIKASDTGISYTLYGTNVNTGGYLMMSGKNVAGAFISWSLDFDCKTIELTTTNGTSANEANAVNIYANGNIIKSALAVNTASTTYTVEIPEEYQKAGTVYKVESNTTAVNTQFASFTYSDGEEGEITPPVDPDPEVTVLTVKEALDKLKAGETNIEAQVKGIISSIQEISTSYGNATYFIKDELTDSEALEIYRGYSIDGARFSKADEIKVGGTVVVEGTLVNYNGTYEFTTGSKIIDYVAPEDGGNEGGDEPVVTPDEYKGNFNSFNNSTPNTSYNTYTNATGWTLTNGAVLTGTSGTSDSNPKFQFIGGDGVLAPTLNGKVGSAGTLVSPTLTDGIGTLTFKYGFAFAETQCKFTINVKDTEGNVIKTDVVDLSQITQKYAYDYSLEVNQPGDFVIEIINDCKSASSSNKDRVSIWNLTWTSFEEPEPEVEHLGTYEYKLTSLDILSNRTEAGVATIEVYKQGEEYWMAETDETNYFLGQTIKFTYSESGDAIFESYVPGKVNGKPAIFSTFTVGNAGSVIEIMPMQNIPFTVETGFDFVPDAGKKPVGLGWLETVSETDDTPMDVIAAYLFENVADEPAIEYDITGNGSSQLDMSYGAGEELEPAEEWPVEAAYVDGKLYFTPLADADQPIVFVVNTEDWTIKAEEGQLAFIDNGDPEFTITYYYGDVASQTLTVNGTIENINDSQSRIVLEPWGEAMEWLDGYFFNTAYFNTVITLDYYFEGAPMYVAPTVEIINFTPAVDEEAEKIDGQVTVKCSVEVEATQATEDEVVLLWGTTEDEDNLIPAERVELVETEAVGTEDSVKTQHIFRIALPYDSEKVVYLQAKTNSAKTEVLPFEITKAVTGVENITVDADSNVRYFNLQGVEISRPAAGTVVIRVSGDKAVKELVK